VQQNNKMEKKEVVHSRRGRSPSRAATAIKTKKKEEKNEKEE